MTSFKSALYVKEFFLSFFLTMATYSIATCSYLLLLLVLYVAPNGNADVDDASDLEAHA
jgi:hypothetical protein